MPHLRYPMFRKSYYLSLCTWYISEDRGLIPIQFVLEGIFKRPSMRELPNAGYFE
jgi:hypothetical protein